jgi:hypothetical protein
VVKRGEGGERRPRFGASGRSALAVAFAVVTAAVAAGQIGRGPRAEIWDDALFFRRVAYNVLHHGFAGWNQVDGPVFVNTSQLYQAICTGLLAAAPRHFNAATILWAAACLAMTFVLLRGRDVAGSALLFVGLSAPPILQAIATGMDTCTVLVTLAVFLRVALGGPSRRKPELLAAMNVLVYLARPDAVLLSSVISIGVLAAPAEGRARRLLTFSALAGAALLLLSAAFLAYYGTAVPLATFLKLNPLSIYDEAYIALGREGKMTNLREIGLVILPLLPVLAIRLDRETLVLAAAGLLFVGFHAATTNEIMGYHARFYAPGLLVVVCAASRSLSVPRVDTPWRRRLVVLVAGGAAALAFLAYRRGGIENATRGSDLDQTPLAWYLIYFVGLPVLGVLGLVPLRERSRTMAAAALASMAAVAFLARSLPRPFTVATDEAIYESSAARDGDLVGVTTIRDCFAEPLQLAHSELGVPGALFPESRIIDYSGLANPSVVSRRFDIEQVCADDRPEFVFRPHWSHRGLNDQVSASRCLAEGYTAVPLPRPSGCPLLVRNDLVARYAACASGGQAAASAR